MKEQHLHVFENTKVSRPDYLTLQFQINQIKQSHLRKSCFAGTRAALDVFILQFIVFKFFSMWESKQCLSENSRELQLSFTYLPEILQA